MPGERDAVETAVNSDTDREVVQSTLALGLMVISKWDRADTKYGSTPGPQQAAEFDSFTHPEMREFGRRAGAMLREHAAIVADGQRPSF